jgi:hypothetical protein
MLVRNISILMYLHIINWKCFSKGEDAISFQLVALDIGVSIPFFVTYLNWASLWSGVRSCVDLKLYTKKACSR